MPRVKAKTPAKKRPFTPAPKKNKAKKPKKGLSKDRARWGIETQRQGEGSRKSKGKQRKDDHDFSNRPRDQPERSALLYSEPTMPPADIAWAVVDQDHPSLQHMYARADTFHSIPPLIPSTSSTSSPTAARFTNPIASIHHNTPLILCIVIGAVVVTATLSVGLAWILRLACCAGERRARRKCRLDRSTSSPSALASAIDSKSDNEKSVGRRSLDSVSLRGDDDLERKVAKIDALFDGETKDTQLDGAVPTLSYGDDVKVPEAPKSTWDGKGWTLFDPPVTGIQQPEPAVTASLAGNTRGGNYSAARQELANQDVGSFTWPSSMERQPSFIERLVQRHHQALELPTTAPLPYPFQAKPVQPASRMASLGGVANRAVMNMLPPTLRNAATTASRQRATRKRYHDMQPYLDSDFEGTIGGKDRELPIARRLRRTEERMAVDCTTEEESNSPLNTLPLYPGQFDDSLRFPRAQQVLMPSPMVPMTLINADSKAPVEFTPGLAGVGAAWPTKGSEPQVSVRSSMANVQMPKVIEPSRASALPLPALDGDRRSRLLGSVGCWLGQITEAGEIADPYTALSPRPDRTLAKNGSLRSDYTSTTLADSATTSSSAQGTARTEGNASGKAELLLQHVDENLAGHDRQQRRLLRKARKYISAVDNDAAEIKQKAFNEEDDVAANVSRAPSIRPQFFAATDLKSWLEPNKVSTTYGIKVLEEGSTVDSDATDPFAYDAETRKLHLRKYDSYESLIPEARPTKAKQRSSSSKQNLRSTVAASPRAAVKDASRQKREALRSVNAGLVRKSSQKALQSAWQSSADLSIVSSVFDEEFAAQSTKRASSKKPSTKNDAEAISTAKAEADAAVRDAWRRHKLLSISSRGSQRIRTTRTTLTESEQVSALLSRAESMRSEPSIYSELTAASDYQFQAPLLSASCGASTFDPVSEDLDEAIEMLSQADDAKRKEETEALLKKQMKEEAKKEAKKEAKREHRRVERQQARDAAAAAEAEAAIAEKLAVRRTNMKQRSVSLGMARSQFAAADADRYATVDDVNVPDSPWTSSDSDISVRRWGGPRRDDSLRRYQNRTSHASMMPHEAAQGKRSLSKQARANSYYYSMGAGSDLRDLC
ncbi:uncharacterized protein UDID_05591 [Ustilago sp. UG-2017a]|nr:uncharacterized protein UDID_05591 [Ustilago sp. UG-2017a]